MCANLSDLLPDPFKQRNNLFESFRLSLTGANAQRIWTRVPSALAHRPQPQALASLESCTRHYQALRYAMNRAEILARRRARLDLMTPEQMEHWRERIRAYDRAYRARWRDHLRSDPERHRAYLDTMREYRRLASKNSTE